MLAADGQLILNEDLGAVLRDLRRERGFTQLRLGDEIGRSHSYVSRMESGGLDPDEVDIELIRRALDLADDEASRLQRSWHRARRAVHLDREEIDQAELVAAACHELRAGGDPALGWRLSSTTARRFIRAACGSHVADESLDQVLRVSGLLLYEATKAFLDIDLVGAVAAEEFRDVLSLHDRLCGGAGPLDIRVRAEVGREASLYAFGHVSEAQDLAVGLLDAGPCLGDELRVELLRAVCINSGILRDGDPVVRAERLVLEEAERVAPEHRLFLLEGLARCSMSPAEAEGRVDRLRDEALAAWGELSLTRRCQAVRTVLAVGARLGTGPDVSMRALAVDVTAEAAAGGLRRYNLEIRDLLDRE